MAGENPGMVLISQFLIFLPVLGCAFAALVMVLGYSIKASIFAGGVAVFCVGSILVFNYCLEKYSPSKVATIRHHGKIVSQ